MTGDLTAAAVLLVVFAAVGAGALAADICLAGRSATRPARRPLSTARHGSGVAVERPDVALVHRRGWAEAPGRTVFPRRPAGVDHRLVVDGIDDTPHRFPPAGGCGVVGPVGSRLVACPPARRAGDRPV